VIRARSRPSLTSHRSIQRSPILCPTRSSIFDRCASDSRPLAAAPKSAERGQLLPPSGSRWFNTIQFVSSRVHRVHEAAGFFRLRREHTLSAAMHRHGGSPRVTPMARVKNTRWLNYNRREPLHPFVHSTLLTQNANGVRCTLHHSRSCSSYRIVARCLLHRRRVKIPVSARRQR
jgi:hypothetical protein